MATLYNTVGDDNLVTSLGGSISAGDSIYLSESHRTYAGNNDLTGDDLLLVHATPGFRGNFEAADPLKVVVNQSSSGELIVEFGGQEFWVQSSSSSGVIYEARFKPTNAGTVYLGPCNCENARVLASLAVIQAGADVANLYVDGAGAVADVREDASYALTLAKVLMGRMTLRRDVGTLTIGKAGEVHVLDDAVSPTTVNLQGGILRAEYMGNVGTLNGDAGVLDISRLNRPMTISTLNSNPSFRIRHAGNLELLTISSEVAPSGATIYEVAA